MSTKAICWAVSADFTLSAPEQLVLILVAHHYSDQSKGCWPSHTLLASESKLSASTVDKALGKLEGLGLISRERGRKGYSTRYTLPRYEGGTTPPQLQGTPPHGVTTPPHGVKRKGTENKKQKTKEATGVNPIAIPKTESVMKVSEIQAKMASKYTGMADSALTSVKKVGGRYTSSGLAKCWVNCAGKYGSKFTAEMTIKDKALFAGAYKRVGDILPHAILAALKDWPGFVSYCKMAKGAYNVPSHPTVPFFIAHVESAVQFLGKQQDADAVTATKPLQSIAKPKPLPATTAAPAPTPAKVSVADLEDVLADLEKS